MRAMMLLPSGGLAAVPSYSADGVEIAARQELDSLLQQTPKIAAHFRVLVSGAPFKPGPGSDVRDRSVLAGGACSRPY